MGVMAAATLGEALQPRGLNASEAGGFAEDVVRLGEGGRRLQGDALSQQTCQPEGAYIEVHHVVETGDDKGPEP